MPTRQYPTRRTLLKALALSSVAGAFRLPGFDDEPDTRIVMAAVHPAIGIARVGNSPDEFFLGPELPALTTLPDGGYKDDRGALKRQAARFRIYGYNAAGQVVRELTDENASIRWTVHVANKKAAWYRFEYPLDLGHPAAVGRRNDRLTGASRNELVIDPGPRSISGRSQRGHEYRFDSGRFLGTPVYLGEVQTDELGRLVFLGGHGVAGTQPGRIATEFANNDGWYDDISDGPVSADVILDGERIPVQAGWVVVGPPNYAPGIASIPTLYDVMVDAYRGVWLDPAATVSFLGHIYPLLLHFTDTQWVNYGFRRVNGWGARYDFTSPDLIARLGGNGSEHAALREEIFRRFRDPASPGPVDPRAWPPMYGDGIDFDSDPRQLLSVTPTQYDYLRRWAAGDFQSDWSDAPVTLSVSDEPRAIDQAALDACTGGAFHPGCELTWPMRHVSLYSAPFRIRLRDPGTAERDYGERLTPDIALGPDGPLSASAPGDLTRWMAVPWQTDAASCRSGYDPDFDPYLPTFWPARVPNHVLTEAQYRRVMDPALSQAERRAAFESRADWFRFLQGGFTRQLNQMVEDFGKQGVVTRRDGPRDGSPFPDVLHVESEVSYD